MQAVEGETLILYHTELVGRWPQQAAAALAARLRYAKRTALGGGAGARASIAGIALALRALGELLVRGIAPGELVFDAGRKPYLAGSATRASGTGHGRDATCHSSSAAGPDFSIAHSGALVGCAALAHGRVGFDLEMGSDARVTDWVVREALLKATGAGMRAAAEVRTLPLQGARLTWRGERWYLQRLSQFAGAAACSVSSRPLHAVAARYVPVAELFA